MPSINNKDDINSLYKQIAESETRNQQIINDVRECIIGRRTPVILTKFKEHAKLLHDSLVNDAKNVFIMYGDNTPKENELIKEQLLNASPLESLILVATGQIIGEVFNLPRLDTLMLAAPVSFAGRLEQYVGRLNRDYEEKSNVVVYDYVDSHLPVLYVLSKSLPYYSPILHSCGAFSGNNAAIMLITNGFTLRSQRLLEISIKPSMR